MTTKVFVANDEFDVMLVSNGFAIGMLVPKYDVVGSGTDSYEFAIDFGTTNTHVEYRVNNGQVTHPWRCRNRIVQYWLCTQMIVAIKNY